MKEQSKYFKVSNLNEILRQLSYQDSILLVLKENVDSNAAARNLTSRLTKNNIKASTRKISFVDQGKAVYSLLVCVGE